MLITPPGGSADAGYRDHADRHHRARDTRRFADVTSLVAAAGNGTYTVADVQAGTGMDRYAGWSLVVVYANAAEMTRNVTVFDGFQIVNGATPTIDISVSGFLTPPSGAVDTCARRARLRG